MNNRFMVPFVVGILIIIIVVSVILAVLFRGNVGSASATPTPTTAANAITVRNDTRNPVRVQDCTAALNACASKNAGTTTLARGASGTETGATGLRVLDLQGRVIGCVALTGAAPGSTVNVSSAVACPS